MSIRKRTLAAAAGLAFAVTTVAAPVALANGDRHDNDNGRSRAAAYPDPTTCADGLLTLVKVRSDEHGNGARVTVAERQDRDAQDALRRAQRADDKARDTRDAAVSAAQAVYKAGQPYLDAAADATAAGVRNQKIANANSEYQAGGTAVALANARQDAAKKRSYLAELRVKLSDAHGAVVRLTVLVNGLCNHTVPAPTEIPEQPPAPVDNPPVDVTPPAPVIVDNPAPVIINNPSIGQVPTGSNTGGGAEAATVE